MNLVRVQILATVLRCFVVLLILRVLISILANYPDYFPPNFNSLFLSGREETFQGIYRLAFYIHIFSSPFVLLNGLILMSEFVRRHCRKIHRNLGRVQVVVLLAFMLPSSMVMSQHAFAGWFAGLSFISLSVITATCAIMGVAAARQRNFDKHRRWILRCFVLICSAIVLRLISGMLGLLGAVNAEQAYIWAAWSSWIVPLLAIEIVEQFRLKRLNNRHLQKT